MLWIHRRAVDREGERGGAQGAEAATQVRRQDLLKLDESAHGGLLDACHRCARGCTETDGDRHRLLVIEKQRGHRASGAKAVSARRAGERVHGVAEPAQPIDVAPDRSARHLEPVRQLAARPVAAPLKQGEQFQKSARGLAHSAFLMLAAIADRY